MNLKGLKINFLGDSITEGVGTSCEEARFVDTIARNTGAICRNYGISGTRMARQSKPSEEPTWDLDFPGRVEGMDGDADVIVVFGGTNDFGHSDRPFGCFEDRTVDTYCGALHVLYTELIEKYPSADIVICTPLHRFNEDCPTGDNKPAPVATLKEYVDMMKRVAEFYSLPVLDLWSVSGLQPQLEIIRERFVPDGLHPNDEGNKVLARKITRFLENM